MLQGHQTWVFENKPTIIGTAAVVGPLEGQGPLAEDFDIIHEELMIGQDSWEKAEKVLVEEAGELAIKKAGLTKEDINFYIGGDLLNQIISNSFAARTLGIPFLGIFGACSTSMESLALAALMVNSNSANYAGFRQQPQYRCRKQFRYPTEYGSQTSYSPIYRHRAGSAVVAKEGKGEDNVSYH